MPEVDARTPVLVAQVLEPAVRVLERVARAQAVAPTTAVAAQALEQVARARAVDVRVRAVTVGVLVAVREALAVVRGLAAVRIVAVRLPAGVRAE